MQSHYALAAAIFAMATLGQAAPADAGSAELHFGAPSRIGAAAPAVKLVQWYEDERRRERRRSRRNSRDDWDDHWDDHRDDRYEPRRGRGNGGYRYRDGRWISPKHGPALGPLGWTPEDRERCAKAQLRCASLSGGHSGDYDDCLSTHNCQQ